MKHLSRERWNELYEEIEEALAIDYIEAELYNRHNQLFRRGCRELGWEASGLMHNRTGCVASGYCSVGCSYDAKNNATKIYVPRIVRAGGQIFSHCQAIRVIHRDGQAQGIEAVALDPYTRQPRGKVIIEAPQVCLSASATGTPAILLRSDIPDPSGRTGEGLTIHPALIAAGEFEEEVHAWRGIPQSYQCTEFLDFQAAHPPPDATPEQLARKDEVGNRSWLVPVFAHPMSTATLLPGWGREHRELMEGYDRLAAYTAMIHDISEGSVRPDGDLGVDIQWKPDEADRRELLFGLERAVELLFASGAKRVVMPWRPLMIFEPGDSLSSIAEIDLESGAVDMTAVHPMSSVSMGDDPAMAVVDSRGAHHQIDGLWVADGSLFPSSIGGPPQVSIYALGLHVGQHIAGTD